MIEWIDDGWIGIDKLGHFILHFIVGFSYMKILKDPIGGIVFSECFGGLYELYDSARGVGASAKDLIWNNIGMISGIIIGGLF